MVKQYKFTFTLFIPIVTILCIKVQNTSIWYHIIFFIFFSPLNHILLSKFKRIKWSKHLKSIYIYINNHLFGTEGIYNNQRNIRNIAFQKRSIRNTPLWFIWVQRGTLTSPDINQCLSRQVSEITLAKKGVNQRFPHLTSSAGNWATISSIGS